MVHDKGDNDIQVFRFVLLEVKLPDPGHVFQQLQMDQAFRITFMFKQKIDVRLTAACSDLVQKIGMIFFQAFFKKAALADFKEFGGKIVFKKRPGIFKIAPGFLE